MKRHPFSSLAVVAAALQLGHNIVEPVRFQHPRPSKELTKHDLDRLAKAEARRERRRQKKDQSK